MLGIILAGLLAASAVAVIKGNLLNPPESPVYEVRYSLSLLDFIFVTGFLGSVIAAVWNAKNTQVHSRWMISTVFWVLSPATTRLSFIPLGMIFQPKEFSDFPFAWVDVLNWNAVLIFSIVAFLIIRDYRREKKIYFSYALVAIVQLTSVWLVNGLKDAPWLISRLNNLFDLG